MGFALDGWGLIGVLLIVLALGLLGGAALGYYTASADLRRERKVARDAGFQSGLETAWDLIGSDARRVASVALVQLAPEPPHLVIPSPVYFDGEDPDLTCSWTGAPQHPGSQRLFDQDAPTEAARAIELRGDD